MIQAFFNLCTYTGDVAVSVLTSEAAAEVEAELSSFLIAMFSTVVILEASELDRTLGSDTLNSIPLQDSRSDWLAGSSLTVLAGVQASPLPSTSGTLRLVGAPRSRG